MKGSDFEMVVKVDLEDDADIALTMGEEGGVAFIVLNTNQEGATIG